MRDVDTPEVRIDYMSPDNSDKGYADLDRMILGAVLHDFEPFELIVSRVSGTDAEYVSDQIERGLVSLLGGGLVGAYLIHAEPPYVTAVAPEPDKLQRYWYMITEEGRRLLQPESEPRAGVLQQ